MPQIVSIAYTPADVERRPAARYARVAAERAVLVADRGIDGDVKGNGGARQLNVMLAETVARLRAEGFHADPGELGEQLVIDGLEPAELGAGVRLRLGDKAVIEVSMPRTPCERFAHIQSRPKESGRGRIGFMARVVAGGEIAVGSAVSVVRPQAASA